MQSLLIPRAVLALSALLLVPGAGAKTYEAIRGESSLTYRIVHPMNKVKGVSRDFECAVDIAPDTVSSRIRVSADVGSFKSGNSSRDAHVMRIVDGRKYPRVEFASDSVRSEGDGYMVSGVLAFHGKSRPIRFLVTPKFTDGKVEISGGFVVKLTDFGVPRPSLLFVKSEDELSISFDVFANLD